MSLVCDPIGLIRTDMQVKFDAPHQPQQHTPQQNVVEIFSGHGYERALADLEGFERIWLIWWFDRNTSWRPMVHTPRGDTRRRGVFATRSPHRPNPIGMTAVPLLEIRGLSLIVGSVDLLDRTPILDIKPYISEVDAFPDQRQGWLTDVVDLAQQPQRFQVMLDPLAEVQVRWLEERWQIDFIDRVKSILERNPEQSRRHRITAPKDGIFRLSSGVWRVFFSVLKDRVRVERLAPGFPLDLLQKEGREVIPHYEAQLAFAGEWPDY